MRYRTYHDITCDCDDCLIGYQYRPEGEELPATSPVPIKKDEVYLGKPSQQDKITDWAMAQDQPFTSRQCCEHTGVNKTVVNRVLRELVEDFQLRLYDRILVGTTYAPRYLRKGVTAKVEDETEEEGDEEEDML